MPPTAAGAGFALDPSAVPALTDALDQARAALASALADAHRAGLAEPAMLDAASRRFQQALRQGAEQQTARLAEFQRRLEQVTQTLTAIQRAYRNHEQASAANLTTRLGS